MKTDAKLVEAPALLERGDWQQAHTIVQQNETQDAVWLHGIVHVLEGDLDNARYWYKREAHVFRRTRSRSSRRHGTGLICRSSRCDRQSALCIV